MARETAAIEINKFNAGLVTDASPLTSPDNSSLSEENFVLNPDGSRNRRWGMDYEDNFTVINTSIPSSNDYTVAHTSYKWSNAGGEVNRNISVIQFGNEIKFFDLSSRPISGNLIHTFVFTLSGLVKRFSFTNVDGYLVVVTQEKTPYIFSISGNTVTNTTQTLLIRDLFGVEDFTSGIDLLSGSGLQIRPSFLALPHLYNLRNQSWGVSRAQDTGAGTLDDPITSFFIADGRYPSNSDNVIQALYADTTLTPNRTIERFFPVDLSKNPLGSTRAANGYFIIDALDRGASRISNDFLNRGIYPALSAAVTTLKQDRTPGGPSVVSEYAGRAWFGGFSGEVIDGDSQSPRMSSYILFSKLVRSISDITQCYQEGDPTSKVSPDLVDTDGGFIRLNEAYGISRMENLGDVLIILAQNGVWKVSGTTDSGFTATNFIVDKVSDRGCINPESAVVVDNTIFYWSDDGIYHLSTQQGDWSSVSISVDRIQRLVEGISEEDRITLVGAYDSFERKVRWVHDNSLLNNRETKELVLDLVLKAFYVNRIYNIGSGRPRVVSVFNSLPYEISTIEDPVTVGGIPVTVGVDPVVILNSIRTDILRGELSYIAVTNNGGNISYTFANYFDSEFVDWRSANGVGVDASAFLVTSYLSGTDFQRGKQIPYLSVHLRRTETRIEEVGDVLVIDNPSSCIIQSHWDWSTGAVSNKWSRPFQAYRYKRDYIPQTMPDNFDTGFLVITTRNKLRGSGKVVSLKFSTEPGKDLHLYGWSMIFSVANNV